MLKRVTYIQYQLIKALHNVQIIVANDIEAFILIQK